MKGNYKLFCECGRPVDHTLPTKDRQCRECFELNRKVLAWHNKTKEAAILNAEQWQESQSRQRLNRFMRYRECAT